MTRFPIAWLRRGSLAVIAAGALSLGGAAAASAATAAPAWTSPSPCPCSTQPPPRHHQPPPPVTHCFLSLETEHDTLAGEPVGAVDQTYADAYWGGQPQPVKAEATVEVVQEVRVCVTEQRGHPDKVTVKDVTGPFAWEIPASGWAPTPSGLPSGIAGMLAV